MRRRIRRNVILSEQVSLLQERATSNMIAVTKRNQAILVLQVRLRAASLDDTIPEFLTNPIDDEMAEDVDSGPEDTKMLDIDA